MQVQIGEGESQRMMKIDSKEKKKEKERRVCFTTSSFTSSDHPQLFPSPSLSLSCSQNMIYSLYIYDRHCDIVYYQSWHRQTPFQRASPGSLLPEVSPHVSLSPSDGQINSASVSKKAVHTPSSNFAAAGSPAQDAGKNGAVGSGKGGLPFDEEAKLVYGVVLSLRNMVKKLTGSPQSNFQHYATTSYALHLFEPPTGLKFILLTSPSVDSTSARTALRTMWGPSGAYGQWVSPNPEKGETDGGEGGREKRKGLDSEQFRLAIDTQMRSMPYFATP